MDVIRRSSRISRLQYILNELIKEKMKTERDIIDQIEQEG